MLKRIIALYLIAVTAYGADFTVNFSDLQSADWVETGVGEYRILWSDIGGVTPPAGLTPVLEWLTGSETNAVDTSGNGLDGTVEANLVWNDATNGMFEFWSEFDSGNTRIFNTNVSSAGLSNVATIAFMAKPSQSDANGFYIAGGFSENGTATALDFKLGGTVAQAGSVALLDGNGSDLQTVGGVWTDALRQDRWNHVAIVADITFLAPAGNIYINGVSQGMVTTNNFSQRFWERTFFQMGERSNRGNDFFGSLGYVQIFDELLTPAQVSSNSIVARNEAGIISDYLASNTNTYWQDTALYVGFNNIIQDGSPNNVNPTTASSPTPKGTPTEGWYDFNGSANYVDFDYIPAFNATTNLTVMVWCNPDVAGNLDSAITSWHADTDFRKWILYINGGQMLSWLNNGDSQVACGIKTAQWTHYAMTYDGVEHIMYSNSVPVGTNAFTTILKTSTNDIHVGRLRESPTLGGWNGLLDECYVLTNALSGADISTYYNSTTNTHSN